MPIVLKSGSLNLLEPSGPVQACNGIAFIMASYVYFSLDAKESLPLGLKGTIDLKIRL